MRMKAGCVAVGMPFVSHAFARSSVTIRGLIDDWTAVPNLLIFSGKEDIGGGTRMASNLMNQFEVDTVSSMPGQRLFSRSTAYVDLNDDRLERITLDNQYDFMADSLFFGLNDEAFYTAAIYNACKGSFAKLTLSGDPTGAFNGARMAGEWIINSVKYQSASFDGFSAVAIVPLRSENRCKTINRFGRNSPHDVVAIKCAWI